jgi:translation elongation factor EF-1alpha
MTIGERIGEVIHFYGKIEVAVLRLSNNLKIGDMIHFLGSHTDFQQEVTSMQIEHEPMAEGKAGDEIAIKVIERARKGDAIFLITDDE